MLLPFAGNASAEPGLVIGFLLPPEEAQSASLKEGAVLAIEQAKSRHLPVELIVRGRVGQWGADAGEAARMVADDGAAGLIASPSGAASHLALQVAGRTAVPIVSLCSDSSVSSTGVPWMVRLAPQTVDEARSLFGHYNSTNHCLAIVPQGRSGREIARDLLSAAKASACSLDKIIEAERSAIDLETIRKETLRSGVKLVLVWLDPIPAAAVVRALRDAGFKGHLAGPGALVSPEFSTALGKAGEDFLVPQIRRDSECQLAYRTFEAAYRANFSRAPSALSALSFDSVVLLLELLQPENRPVRQQFPLQLNLPAASGRLQFDAEGNRKLELELLTLHNGNFVSIIVGGNDFP